MEYSSDISAPERVANQRDSDVYRLEVNGRDVILVGTAHISQESTDLVKRVIEQEKPDRVCVELDQRRYDSISNPNQWENLDLRQVIRKKQLSTLIAHLILASYQKRLGAKLGVLPGMELMEAAQAAEALNIPLELCDRDIAITLKRTWRLTPLTKKFVLLSTLLASVFEQPEIDEDKLKELRQQDVLSELLQELGRELPTFKQVLIDERDAYLAEKIRASEGNRVVAVVGAGHVKGILEHLEQETPVALKPLEHLPPSSTTWKWFGYGIPALIVASIAWIAHQKGLEAAGDNVMYWILANGIPSALGALAAWAHPVTILTAFFAAPLTSLTPVIGAGYVTAFVQAYMQPPRIKEIRGVADDLTVVKRWWQNRLLKVFLAFILPGLGSLIGTWVGGVEIIRNAIQ